MIRRLLIVALAIASSCSKQSEEDQESGASPVSPEKSISLRLDLSSTNHVTVKETAPGVYEILTTGSDPWIKLAEIGEDFDPAELKMFAFEYFCPDGIDDFTVYFGKTIAPWSPSASAGRLPKAETWVGSSLNMEANGFGRWKDGITALRIDPGTKAGVRIQIRDLRLRTPNTDETRSGDEIRKEREAKSRRAAQIKDYLATDHPAKVHQITATIDSIEIGGIAPDGTGVLELAEIRIHEEPWQMTEFTRTTTLAPGTDGSFVHRSPRLDGSYDRLLSRWAVVRKNDDGGHELISHATYATDVSGLAKSDIRIPETRTKKGMGGIEPREILPELVELGVEHVTVNIVLQDMVLLEPDANSIPHDYNGRTFHMRRSEVEEYDQTVKFSSDHGMVVSLIILTGFPADEALRDALIHPESTKPGLYGMPNLTESEGAELYAASLDFLAGRYADPSGPHGLVSNWIMHNEVDYAWTWSNMGVQPMEVFMDTHVRSMRMAHLIARKHNPHARTFLSLTHSWGKAGPAGRSYVPRDMVDLLAGYSRREGDFEWGLAYHPYPQSLFKPATWNDTMATFSFDTPMITLKNIEVLDAYLRKPAMLYRGEKVRGVLLSEQGYHTEGYSDEAQKLQAAAFVYTWHKIRPLSTIEAFQNHRWVDHPDEGGLKLGVRTLPDDQHPFGRRKLSWDVLQALDTPAEAAATEFAKPIIGVRDFSEIPYKGEIR